MAFFQDTNLGEQLRKKIAADEAAKQAQQASTGSVIGNFPNSVLQERSATHGDFEHWAKVSQRLKFALAEGASWNTMGAVQREALEAVMGKLARIVTGDPNFIDHYRDIIGYTQRAMDYTAKQPLATDSKTTKFQVNGAVVKVSA